MQVVAIKRHLCVRQPYAVKRPSRGTEGHGTNEKANPSKGGGAKPRGRTGRPGYRTWKGTPMDTKRLIGAAAAIGVAAALAGSAFTNSNTMPVSGGTAGYGSVSASGITVTGIEYVASTTDGSKLDKVKVSTADANATSMTGTLSIKDSGGTLVVGSQGCGAGVSNGATPAVYTFTCDPSTDPAVADVVTVGFTATRNAA